MNGTISKQALRRLPFYLDYLKKKQTDGVRNISATTVANDLKLNEVQVRKDLAAVSLTGGKPKTGYVAEELIRDLESFLGYDNTKEAVIAGAGKLGQALLAYKEFERYGLNVVAAFDTDESTVDGKHILSAEKMSDICSRLKIHIGIICVPPESAQKVCDEMVECGILAIWNFAPVHLSVPSGVIVQYENLAASLAVLSQNLEFEIKDSLIS
ncbi:MAG TPA: redox-sensing transcriptional repressor Rex [Ruminococcaceae bacterium]|nr:redox-sensing transcriptional repressor Rex [Oscillospiraceae bacterium]HCE26202.1 redox-sensing transcriptional repressor Rex [Oscillospiraceae bacterium]